MLAAVKKLSPSCGRPVANMWCTQRPKAISRRDQRQHQRQIAEHRPPRERRNDRRDHADRRQEDDVDLGMAEEPEQVLPEQRVAALRRVEEMRADQPVEDQRGARHHDRRHREDHHERDDQHAQTNIGMRFSDMPGARSLKTVVISDSTATASAEISVKVIICAQTSARLPGV